jgi:hypothetical protein
MSTSDDAGGVAGWPTSLAFLYGVAMEAGIGVCDFPGGDPYAAGGIAAIVTNGNLIALNSAVADDGLRADVLAMALEVATVMTDRPGSRRSAIYAPEGFVVITGNRVQVPAAGVGRFATVMVRKSGRDTDSAAFEYYIPRFGYSLPEVPRHQPLAGHDPDQVPRQARRWPTRTMAVRPVD